MSKTPRTDEREFAAIDLKPSARVVYASFARQLETELANSEKKVFAYKTALEQSESELAEARAEIERKDQLIEQMRDTLKHVRQYSCSHMQRTTHIDAALSAAERIIHEKPNK
mgnify:CR=1 FL=1